jgi:hypothetical protein
MVSFIASFSLSNYIFGAFSVNAYHVVIQDRLLVKFCVVKSVKTGVLECWSIGVLIKPEREMVQILSFHLSVTPSLQLSITPATQWYDDIDKDPRIN